MKRALALALVGLGAVLLVTTQSACSSSLSQPFEGMKSQPVTIHRLIPVEQAAAQPGAAAPIQLPPQVQQWLSGAAQLLPPGLLPPGLLPGSPQAPETSQRFYNFKIVGTTSVTDNKVREEILDIFGKEKNFENPRMSCLYPEFGFQIGQPMPGGAVQGAPNPNAPADVLVSFSCQQVQMYNHQWPYGTKTGLTRDASDKLMAVIRKAFGG